jgi:hypothetical protein
MLEGLDSIDWASLAHAHGSAADLPELLRSLLIHSRLSAMSNFGRS